MPNISDAKKMIAAKSLRGLEILGAGVSKNCFQGRYDAAAKEALTDPDAKFSQDERDTIAVFIGEEAESVTERRIIISLPTGMNEALRERAHREKISIAEAVRRGIQMWLEG